MAPCNPNSSIVSIRRRLHIRSLRPGYPPKKIPRDAQDDINSVIPSVARDPYATRADKKKAGGRQGG
jgi:hypothetical protein